MAPGINKAASDSLVRHTPFSHAGRLLEFRSPAASLARNKRRLCLGPRRQIKRQPHPGEPLCEAGQAGAVRLREKNMQKMHMSRIE